MEIYKNLSLEDLPNEEWRDILGYEGAYMVSNMGRVKSLERKSMPYSYKGTITTYTVREKICRQSRVLGYLIVSLSKEGVQTFYKVHRLVAQAFIPNTSNMPIINHKNEEKIDNCVGNLEWCDYQYNSNYGTRNKRLSDNQRNDVKKSKKVLQYSLDGKLIKEWPSICEAGRAGYDRKAISRICRGCKTYHTTGGYIWKFK